MSFGTSSQLLNRPAVGGEYRTRSSKFSSLRSTPHVGMGLRSKISKDLTRLARIHSGSPLIFDSSAITSRDTPVRAFSWPCSSSTMGLGLVIRVLSVAAKTGPFKSPIPELGIVPGGVREKPVTGRKSGASRASKARMRRLTPLLVSLIVLSPADGARADALPPVKHAFVIVLENSDFEDNFQAGRLPRRPIWPR